MTPIHLGISTCPNDTFAFHGILEGKVNLRGLDFRIDLLDVEELNRRLFAGDFDVAKASFHAALRLRGTLGVLPVGSALGFGVGPLLLAARPNTHPRDPVPQRRGGSRLARVLCPGAHTTATLLYELFHAAEGAVEQVVFSDIMPALAAGAADFGVCIHEGRFTWRAHGLALVEDLGALWEAATAAPLPLGGIFAQHALGPETIQAVTAVLDTLDRQARRAGLADPAAPPLRCTDMPHRMSSQRAPRTSPARVAVSTLSSTMRFSRTRQ